MKFSTLASQGRVAVVLAFALGCVAAHSFAATANAQEPQWIWSPAQPFDSAPEGSCYFRKSFDMNRPESGELQITCDDAYELYINGRQIAKGSNWKVLDVHDISKYLQSGRNVIAVKATNVDGSSAALAARLIVQSQGGTHVSHFSDKTWKTSLKEIQHWARPQLNDSQWLPAHEIGAFNKTKPWYDQVQLAGGGQSGRFQASREFQVDTVIEPKDTGSLVAMCFNEFGHILAARENGPILLIRDTDRNKIPDSVDVYSDYVKHVQGILALNGQVFVIGEAEEGVGFYRLSDEDNNGQADTSKLLLEFNGKMGEHGPHSPVLGPDGLIYIMIGNHSSPKAEVEATSPHRNYYEGDLVGPRYEDPGGHAAGIKVPGGSVIRTDAEGSFVEMFAGGFRNAYDMAFNRQGDLLTSDSDMEWDEGMTWYRPTRVNHIVPGGEYGWRSGWAVWPDYYFDSLPSTLDTGRGSPAGVAVYDHFMYPTRLHNAMFVADWSRGQILAVKMKQSGGSYIAQSEVFLSGKPLNATDLAVGPDGAVYFCTGGRNTEGGIFRVTWKGRVPPNITDTGRGLEAAIRQPQFGSAYARQRIALVKETLGDQWDTQITAVAEDPQAQPEHRVRALNLMQLFGPFPSSEFLIQLAGDANPEVRAKAAYLMGIHADEATGARLVKLLRDKDAVVARTACEALVRAGQKPPVTHLSPLLASSDPFVAWSARRVLEQMPIERWQDLINASEHRVFLQVGLALMTVDPTPENALLVLNRASALMKGFVKDKDFLDMLRLMQVAMHRSNVSGDDIPEIKAQLANEFPSSDPKMNRELVKLLVYLQDTTVMDRMLAQLAGDIPMTEKVHLAVHARYLKGWDTRQKLELLKFYEHARTQPGGHSFVGYIENVSRDFFADFTTEERLEVLSQGARWPGSALAALAKLPPDPNPAILNQLVKLDRELSRIDTEPAKRLAIGIVAVLGRSGDPEALAYLRDIYKRQPERRSYIAVGLAQSPGGENFPVLVESLSIVEGAFAQEVLTKLATVDDVPEEPEAVRQVILRGLKLGTGGKHAIALLEKWTEQQVSEPSDPVDVALGKWQDWFSETFPELPEAKLPTETAGGKWTYDELLTYLTSTQAAAADHSRGEHVFTKAQCIKCHRYGERGEGIGPDLSTVSRRFQKKEILESILFPSHVISDQYASKSVLTVDGKTYTGITGPEGSDPLVILQSDGEKVSVPGDEIEEIAPSKVSAMPDGLLNSLTLEEIADLFAYMSKPPRATVTSRGGAPRE